MTSHPPASEVIETYLSLVDDCCPGLLRGLYLYGSLALDDFRPGSSDIDFVAVSDVAIPSATLRRLRAAHRRLSETHPRPHFDGIYVTWDELARNPSGTSGPHIHEGAFDEHGEFERLLVTWHTLKQCGVAVRGPGIGEVEVATDPPGLTAWTHDNLDGYWRRWCQAVSHSTEHAHQGLRGEVISWGVLGVCRLHHTLATGAITSKTGAGRYARRIFDARWHPIVEEALRIRCGDTESRFDSLSQRRAAALDFIGMVIDDAHRQDPFWRSTGDNP